MNVSDAMQCKLPGPVKVEGRLLYDSDGPRLCEDQDCTTGIWIGDSVSDTVGRVPGLVGGDRLLDSQVVVEGSLRTGEDGRLEIFDITSLVVFDDEGAMDVPLRPLANNEILIYDLETNSLRIIDEDRLFFSPYREGDQHD